MDLFTVYYGRKCVFRKHSYFIFAKYVVIVSIDDCIFTISIFFQEFPDGCVNFMFVMVFSIYITFYICYIARN